jgi:hypothetical protein
MKTFLPLMTETAKRESTVVNIINTSSIGAHFTAPGRVTILGFEIGDHLPERVCECRVWRSGCQLCGDLSWGRIDGVEEGYVAGPLG